MKLLMGILITSLFSHGTYAHGENIPGPNKGFVQMSGKFHTELVPETDGNFLVYLLDINNQNPAIKDSTVEFKVTDPKGTISYKCLPVLDHFNCVNEKKIRDLKEAKIIIKAKRLGVKAEDAVYDLPLSLTKPAKSIR